MLGLYFRCSVYSQWTFIRDELASFRPMDMDSSGPSHRARRASFLSSSVAPFTPFGSSLFEKRSQLGWRSNNYRLTVQCSWVEGWNIGVNDDKLNGMTVEMSAWTVTRLMGWLFEKTEVVRYTKFLTSCPEAFMAHDMCRLSVGFYLGSKRCFVFRALFL